MKETKAPKGFQLDKNVYTMTVKVNETTTLKVSDTPKVTDTLVELFKIDMEISKATPQGNGNGGRNLYRLHFRLCGGSSCRW